MVTRLQQQQGWIRIMEALIAILLLASIFLITIQKEYIGKPDYSSEIYQKELTILRGLRLNDTLKEEILTSSTPKSWENFPSQSKLFILNQTPSYLDCQAQLCSPETVCDIASGDENNLYTRSALFAATDITYNPTTIVLACSIVTE